MRDPRSQTAAEDELKRIVKHSFIGELRPVSFEINLADVVEARAAEDIRVSTKQKRYSTTRDGGRGRCITEEAAKIPAGIAREVGWAVQARPAWFCREKG